MKHENPEEMMGVNYFFQSIFTREKDFQCQIPVELIDGVNRKEDCEGLQQDTLNCGMITLMGNGMHYIRIWNEQKKPEGWLLNGNEEMKNKGEENDLGVIIIDNTSPEKHK